MLEVLQFVFSSLGVAGLRGHDAHRRRSDRRHRGSLGEAQMTRWIILPIAKASGVTAIAFIVVFLLQKAFGWTPNIAFTIGFMALVEAFRAPERVR